MRDLDAWRETAWERRGPARARGLAAFADAAWLRTLIGVLAVLSMVTLIGTLGCGGDGATMALLHALSGAALFVVLVVWLMASRSALDRRPGAAPRVAGVAPADGRPRR